MKPRAALLAASLAALVAAVLLRPASEATAQLPATSRPPAPAYTHGAASAMTVYLDFGDRLGGTGTALGDAEVYTIFYRVAEYLSPSLGVTVTTVPPASRPGEYVTVRILADGAVPWSGEGAAGTTPVRMYRNTSWWVPNVAYVGTQGAGAEWTAVIAAHEAVHALQPDGVGHEETAVAGAYLGRNLMSAAPGPGARLSPGMAATVVLHVEELRAGWRMGAFVNPQGQWTFDWHQIGD